MEQPGDMPHHPRVSVLFNEPKLLKFCFNRGGGNDNYLVSVLFNEPKLLKFDAIRAAVAAKRRRFSALQRAEIAEIILPHQPYAAPTAVSVLFNEPKLLKWL